MEPVVISGIVAAAVAVYGTSGAMANLDKTIRIVEKSGRAGDYASWHRLA